MTAIPTLGRLPAAEGAPQSGGSRERIERIYAVLRKRICLLDYAPGERLREETLADEFDVSRTPIRRVLARLEDEGLVRSVHGVGTIVPDIDVKWNSRELLNDKD